MKILYYGPVEQPSGYGVAARSNVDALRKAGIEVDVLSTNGEMTEPWSGDAIICHGVPAALGKMHEIATQVDPKSFKVAYTTWESVGMPKALVDHLRLYDKVMVPGQFYARALDAYLEGKRRVGVVPHPIDREAWAPYKEERLARLRKNTPATIKFLSVLTWNERKNPLGLLMAYWHAFHQKEPVELHLIMPSYEADQVEKLKRSSGIDPENLPPVFFHGLGSLEGRLGVEEYRRLFSSCDVYVTAARAEGFGLGVWEAAACGLPVIGPTWGDMEADLFVECQKGLVYYAPFVSSRKVELPDGRTGRAILRNAHTGARGDQVWAEPRLVHLANRMKFLSQTSTRLVQEKTFNIPMTPVQVGQLFKELLDDALRSR